MFCGGYVKSLVYADKPQTLDHLEDNIRRVIADIRQQMLEKVIENWTSRLDYIRASHGSRMPEIIFKMIAIVGNVGREYRRVSRDDQSVRSDDAPSIGLRSSWLEIHGGLGHFSSEANDL
ncbi:hypothetical protein TNCV_4578191 [Trichonephila clavipes]|nr:hypothetical protein TNCV_4578191 [Trichonephila clavipes]